MMPCRTRDRCAIGEIRADADPDERLDLVMVALLELAAVDARVRDRVSSMISKNDVTAGQLGKRLLPRAELHEAGEPE